MKVNGVIPSLLNGVSQQAAAMRLVTQLEDQINGYSTLLKGLGKRPPTQRVAEIAGSVGAFVHIINRDLSEKYIVVVSSGSIRVFDFNGNEKTVNTPNGVGYLTNAAPTAEVAFTAMTINDYTFIVNRNVTAAMAATPTVPTRSKEALINVVAGNYGRTYVVRIDGQEAAKYVAPVGDNANQSPGVATTVIAAHLYRDLQTSLQNAAVTTAGGNSIPGSWNPGGGDTPQLGYAAGLWSVGIHQNAIHIVRNDGADFAISIDDGLGGSAMKLAKDEISKFSDLPQYGPHGFRIKVSGSANNDADNYWVWADKGGTDNNSKVTWREAPAPGTKLDLDASTMPHVLVRETSGAFTFKRATWDSRKCGDGIDISPDPSFVGRTINDVFFHRNRFGILSDDGVILSRSGSFFDFFRKTATALLDDDPIDVAVAHVKVSIMRGAAPVQDNLILFSENTQFRLAGNELLTAKTATIRPLTEYPGSNNVRPIVLGSTIFFVSDGASAQSASVYEYTYDQQRSAAFAAEITSHVPAYLPSGITQLIGCVDEGMVFALSANKRGSLFVYRYYWQNDEKVQSSWSEWTLAGGEIMGGASIRSDLYLVVRRGTRTFLERIRLDTAAVDDNLELLVCLDQRTAPTFVEVDSSGVLPATTFSSTFIQNPSLIRVVGQQTGKEYRVSQIVGNNIQVYGNVQEPVWAGESYVFRGQLSTQFYRQAQGQSSVVRRDGRLQIQSMTFAYSDTGYFRVEIERPSGVTKSDLKIFRLSPGIELDTPKLASGTLNVPIMAKNDVAQVTIVNDTWLPSYITGVSWRGVFAPFNREGL